MVGGWRGQPLAFYMSLGVGISRAGSRHYYLALLRYAVAVAVVIVVVVVVELAAGSEVEVRVRAVCLLGPVGMRRIRSEEYELLLFSDSSLVEGQLCRFVPEVFVTTSSRL